MRRPAFALLALLALAALTTSAQAGPPCICWPIEIGELDSLPWGEREMQRSADFETRQAVGATLALLDADLPVLGRMETLRRATIYLDRDVDLARKLLLRLMARALDAESSGTGLRALAWFDAGYCVACYRQMGMARDFDGYPWIRRGIDLSGGDGAMHLGAALVTLMGNHSAHDAFHLHVARATDGARSDELLRKNLDRLGERSPAILEYFAKRKK